jgi:hypothetical protein
MLGCDRMRENFQQLKAAANMTFHWVILFVIPVVIDFRGLGLVSLGSLQSRELCPSFDLALRSHNTDDKLGNTLKPEVRWTSNSPLLDPTILHAMLTKKVVG